MPPSHEHQSWDDETLIQKAAGGSHPAFVELVERRGRELFRFFRFLGADSHEADDCVQETFLRLFAYRRRFRASFAGGFRALLYRVARNVRADALRRKRRAPPYLPLHHALHAVARDDRGSPAIERSMDLEWALLSLPEKLRGVVVLNVFQGLTYREIAEALQIPLGTVKSRMSLALLRLREVLHAPATR